MTKQANKSLPLIALLIPFVMLAIYTLFPSKMHFADGLYFSYHLENFPISHSWHPHHLFWLPLMHVIFNAVHAVLPSLRAMSFFQYSNAILGAITVLLMIKFIFQITQNRIAGIIIGAFFGLSWGMLHYSADANIYILILMLIMVVALIVTKGNILSRKSAIIATMLMILITSFHQIGFFFAIVILTAILLRSDPKEKVKTAITCIALYGIVTLGLYYAVYQMIRPLLFAEMQQSFIAWMTAYGGHQSFWSISEMGYFPAQMIFQYTQFGAFAHNQDLLNARSTLSFKGTYNTDVIDIFFHVVILCSVLIQTAQIVLKKNSQNRQIKIILLVWFFLYFIFNQIYCAFEIHFKMFFIIPLLAIWTIQILESSSKELKIWTIITVSLITAMTAWNFITGVIPDSKPDTNPFLKEALLIQPFLKDGDLVIYARHERYQAAVTRYYTDADAVFFQTEFRYISTDEDSFSQMHDQTVDFFNNQYSRIILSDEAWKSGYTEWFFSGHIFPPPHPDLMALQKPWLTDQPASFKPQFIVKRLSDIINKPVKTE